MFELSGGERISTIGSAVLTQYRIVTDRHTDRHLSTNNSELMHSIARFKNLQGWSLECSSSNVKNYKWPL